MSAFEIEIESGKTVRLPTAGKYRDRDICVTAKEQAGGYDEGYDAGKQATIAQMWEGIQLGGSRTYYRQAFRGERWDDSIYFPPYPINGECQQIFHTTGITDTKVPIVVDGTISYGFQAADVKIIHSLDLTNATAASNCFYSASEVESITFTGLIKINGLNVSPCSNLKKECIVDINTQTGLFYCLEDKTGDTSGTEWVVTIGSTHRGKLTDDELSVATKKGWTVK